MRLFQAISAAVRAMSNRCKLSCVLPISVPASDEPSQPWSPDRISPEPNERRAERQTPSQALGELSVVGKAERKIDAVKLVTGKSAFVDDIELRSLLYARILTSPHAHAVIREIDVSEARALPGVHAVLTYKDVPRVAYTRAGQSWPDLEPHDQYALDNRVRFVGDRVAVVAAETLEIAEHALKLIQVDYEVLPAVHLKLLACTPSRNRLALTMSSIILQRICMPR